MALVQTEDRGGVRHLVLNRPEKRNAMNGELIQALGAAIEDAAADDSTCGSSSYGARDDVLVRHGPGRSA